jgi:hypothetical protein
MPNLKETLDVETRSRVEKALACGRLKSGIGGDYKDFGTLWSM